MTDEQIIKALECCISDRVSCKKCPLYGDGSPNCWEAIRKNALDLINRQKAEIDILIEKKDTLADENSELMAEVERLKKLNDEIIDKLKCMTEENHKLACDKHENEIRVIKEFAERLKKEALIESGFEVLQSGAIDNLVKEMVGDE